MLSLPQVLYIIETPLDPSPQANAAVQGAPRIMVAGVSGVGGVGKGEAIENGIAEANRPPEIKGWLHKNLPLIFQNSGGSQFCWLLRDFFANASSLAAIQREGGFVAG